jgi:hypothetical protein
VPVKTYRVRLPATKYSIVKRLMHDKDGYELWDGPFDSLSKARSAKRRFYDTKKDKTSFFLVKERIERVPDPIKKRKLAR